MRISAFAALVHNIIRSSGEISINKPPLRVQRATHEKVYDF